MDSSGYTSISSWCSSRIFHCSQIHDELFKEKSTNQRANVKNDDDANGYEAFSKEDQPNDVSYEQTTRQIIDETKTILSLDKVVFFIYLEYYYFKKIY
jgi:hypothetical protein